MSYPVVHFEVIGKDPDRLRSYFGDLFGWHFDTPSPVAAEVSEPGGYGFLELIAAADGTGIRVASGEDRPSSVHRHSPRHLGWDEVTQHVEVITLLACVR